MPATRNDDDDEEEEEDITNINPRSQCLGQEQKNILRHYLFENKTLQAKFRRTFNFNNYPKKIQSYRWVHKF